jgi:hypothetical protein
MLCGLRAFVVGTPRLTCSVKNRACVTAYKVVRSVSGVVGSTVSATKRCSRGPSAPTTCVGLTFAGTRGFGVIGAADLCTSTAGDKKLGLGFSGGF